ncbi:MAG: hypothetical protein WAW85_16830 [Gordonia sp. (in: high G+C Gram-positive bacteria)]|uniref:hypothetical protein n=1 Tax=Gordonia sp. (in: high G+C Gram-positive bacteria) TaxID=84139 RepID=UPI003BB7972A
MTPRSYQRSTAEQRAEAVSLVKGMMAKPQSMSRARAAAIVGRAMGFSRSAVIGWCEDAGLIAAEESPEVRALKVELEASRSVALRLSKVLGEA